MTEELVVAEKAVLKFDNIQSKIVVFTASI
jgi:hypothetical protein